jgi:superfamily II DNA or RNA helicase
MKEFGIYTFAFKKSAPKSEVKAYNGDDYTRNDFMVGEINLDSKSYEGLPLDIACKKRIEQELKAKHGLSYFDINDIIDLKCYLITTDKTSHVDTDIRNYIIKYIEDTSIAEGTTEVIHNISRYWLDKAIFGYTHNNPNIFRTKSFPLYSYQEGLKANALTWLQNHNRCLYHLSTRGGKSYLSLDTALEDGAENILILTPFPAAQGSFADIVKFHTKFIDWTFYTKDDITTDTVFQSKKNAVLLSWQIFDKDLEKAKIKNILDQVKFTHAIIDETHNTSSSARSESIIKNLEDDVLSTIEETQDLEAITEAAVEVMEDMVSSLKQIHLSGTPYNDILGARFSKDETFTFDFIDLIKLDRKTGEVCFPDLNVWNVCNMSTLNELLVKAKPDVFELEEGFTLKKAFATKARTRALLDLIFDSMFNPEDSDSFDGTEDARLVFDGVRNKHVLAFVPTIKAASWAEEYLREKLSTSSNPVLRKYRVLAVSGETSTGNDIDTSAKKGGLEKYVNEFEANNEYTIVVTCLKLTTGVTLRRTDSILLLRNCSSVETFVQILFRAMTPNKEKTEANLYCFDSNISLNVVKETLRIRQENDDHTGTEHIKELFGVINFKKFWANDGFAFDINKAEEWLKAVRNIPVNLNLFKMFTTAALSCIVPNLTDDEKTALFALDTIKRNSETNIKTIAKGVCDNVNQKNYKSSGEQGSYTKSEIEHLLARLETLFSHLDWAIINNNITDIEDLLTNYHIKLDGNTPSIVKSI